MSVERGRKLYGNSREPVRVTGWNGLQISVEYDAGQTRRGIGDYGQTWEKTFTVPYGEILGTHAVTDGDPVDVYLGPTPSDRVYVVHQLNREGRFDEDKVMLDFDSKESAVTAYVEHAPPWGFGSVDEMSIEEFLNGYLASNRDFPRIDV